MLLQIDITNKCNLKCPFCRRQKERIDGLDEKSVCTILDNAYQYGFRELNISGGEPFLHQGIYGIVDRADKIGFEVITITSNGTISFDRKNEKLINLLKKLALIQISIDDIKVKHDRLRGLTGAYDKAIDFAIFAKIYTQVVIKSVITRNNLPRIIRLKDLLKQKGLNAYSIRPLIPSDKRDLGLTLSYAEFRRLYLKLHDDKDIIVFSEDPLFNTFCPSIPESEYDKIGGCLAGIDLLYINSEGEVYPCAYLKLNLGNIKNQSFSDVFNHPVMLKLKSRKLEGHCEKCHLRLFCGGCRAFAYLNSGGNYMTEDFRCEMRKNGSTP